MIKYKVVKRKMAMSSAAAHSFSLTKEVLDPTGAEIVEVDTSDEDEFIAQAKDADAIIGGGIRYPRSWMPWHYRECVQCRR